MFLLLRLLSWPSSPSASAVRFCWRSSRSSSSSLDLRFCPAVRCIVSVDVLSAQCCNFSSCGEREGRRRWSRAKVSLGVLGGGGGIDACGPVAAATTVAASAASAATSAKLAVRPPVVVIMADFVVLMRGPFFLFLLWAIGMGVPVRDGGGGAF